MQNMQNIRNIKNICMKVFHDHIQDSKWYFSYRGIEFKLRQERIGSHRLKCNFIKRIDFLPYLQKGFSNCYLFHAILYKLKKRASFKIENIDLRISIYCANIKSKNIEEKMYSNWRENIILKNLHNFFFC